MRSLLAVFRPTPPTVDLPPAFADLPASVNFIVRSPEQPPLDLLLWDDEVRNRVFGMTPMLDSEAEEA